ncbi:unnamed protein product, partial [Brassicogethes aeneus]
KKIDNRKKTGSEGGPDCKLNETDNLIIDILGRDTALVKGLSSKETWEKTIPSVDEMGKENKENEMPSTPALVNTVKAKKSCTSVPVHNESELRVKKLKLSLEIMEKESYLKSLEIFKQEKELGLLPSYFTAIFHAAQQEILITTRTPTKEDQPNNLPHVKKDRPQEPKRQILKLPTQAQKNTYSLPQQVSRSEQSETIKKLTEALIRKDKQIDAMQKQLSDMAEDNKSLRNKIDELIA